MPELPDVVAYMDALRPRVVGCVLKRARIVSPFVLRTAEPGIEEAEGRRVRGMRRIGKRIVLEMEAELFLVFHLMIAGRFRWAKPGSRPVGKIGLAAFEFAEAERTTECAWAAASEKACAEPAVKAVASIGGTLQMTEASGKKRASLHVVRGEAGLKGHDPGGMELLSEEEIERAGGSVVEALTEGESGERGVRVGGVMRGLQTRHTGDRLETRPTEAERLAVFDAAVRPAFAAALRRENHTVKRTLTDPRLIAGIGNAYSDEILHAARTSPLALTRRMDDQAVAQLLTAARTTLLHWIAAQRAEFAGRFPGPGEITAFRPGFAVHGRYGKPCPVCKSPVQRIRYADNETNYCPRCQTQGRVLADRSLSRLLREDWPRTVEELE